MLLIPLFAFGYAQWNDTLTVVSYMRAGTESIRITSYNVTYYNGYGNYTLYLEEDTLYFNETNLFPGWELKLEVVIHNNGTIPVNISYNIYYSWDQNNWVKVEDPQDPKELYDEFGIVYTDGLYNETGEPWDPSQYLWPCETVYKIEHLLFDAQDRPDLQGKTFTIKVEIIGTVGIIGTNGR